jgi:hypothetical protein
MRKKEEEEEEEENYNVQQSLETPLGNLWKVNGHDLHCIAPPFKTT